MHLESSSSPLHILPSTMATMCGRRVHCAHVSLMQTPNGYTQLKVQIFWINSFSRHHGQIPERVNLREERVKRHMGLSYAWWRITLQWWEHEVMAWYISGKQEAKRAQVWTLWAVTQKACPPATHLLHRSPRPKTSIQYELLSGLTLHWS